ncbi:MAG: hypothetical protein V8Q65_07355 [Bacteroidaceae bacterium]
MKHSNLKFNALLLLLFLLPQLRAVAQESGGDNTTVNPVFVTGNMNQIEMSYDETTKEYTFTTTGGDPYVFTNVFETALPADSNVVSFEYSCTTDISDFQIFFPNPLSEANSIKNLRLPATKEGEWALFNLSLEKYTAINGWGKVGDCMRMDFCTTSGVEIKVRNLHIGTAKEGRTLQEYVDALTYVPDDLVFSNAPGCVGDEAAYKEYYNAYNDALQLLGSPSATDEEMNQMLQRLKIAYKAIVGAINPLTDGTYFIQTAYSVFNDKDIMSWYAPRTDNQPGWKKQENSLLHMWEIKKLEDKGYSIRSLATGQYINHNRTVDVADEPLVMSENFETAQVIQRIAPNGQFIIHSLGASWTYNVQGHGAGANTSGPIANWTDKGVSGEGAWRIVPVTDEQLAEAEASKGRDNLIIALAKYENLTDGAEVGPEIGKPHTQEQIDELNDAISVAREFANGMEATDEEIKSATQDLVTLGEAFKKAVNTIPDGYYRIRSKYNVFDNNYNDVYFSAYSDERPGWSYYQKTSAQLWKITNVEGGYTVQNAKNGLYINNASSAVNAAIVYFSDQPEVKQKFSIIKPNGKWNIYNELIEGFAYVPANHSKGLNQEGSYLIIWNSQGEDSDTSWSLEQVDDADAQSLIANESDNELNIKMQTLYEEARAVYNSKTNYAISDQPIIKSVDQIYANNFSPNEGANLQNLIDGDKNTFWNSTWEGIASEQDPNNPHYLRIYDESGFPDTVQVNYVMRQNGTWHRVPVKMRIQVSNDADSWTTLYDYKEKDLTNNGEYNLRNLYTDSLHYIVTGIGGYKYVRFITQVNIGADGAAYIVGGGHQMHEYAEFNLYRVTGVEETSVISQSWNKAFAAELFAAIQEATPQYLNGTATQASYDRLLAAYNKFVEENAGGSEFEALYPRLDEIATNAEVGEGLGFVDSQDAIDNFWNAISEAYNDYNSDAPQNSPASNLKKLNDAYDELISHVTMPQPNKWYNIVSNTTRAYGADQPVFLASTSVGDNMHIGTYQKDMFSYASDPYAIWRFVPAKEEEGAYYIQSMGTGQYLGAYRGLGADLAPQMSHTPGIYKVYFYGGNGGFRMRQTNVDDPFNNLKADGSRFLVLNYPANGDHQQSWRFEEVGEDEILQFNFFTGNSISVVTLPWATKGSGSINALNGDEFKTYAVKNLEITEDGTRLELTRKDDFEAGEPMILVAGDYESSEHPNVQVQFNVPTDVVDTAAVTANGLVGTLEGFTIKTEGMGYFQDGALKSITGSKFFEGRSGYIDPGKVVNNPEASVDLVITTSETLNGCKTVMTSPTSEVVNVYTIDGVLVKKNVKALKAVEGLKKGIYIIGGKKKLVK